MNYDQDELGQRVAVALLYDVIEERKPQIQALIKKHGMQPLEEPDDLYYQVVQLSNERGGFFDVDLVKESNEAGYFGIDTIAAMGLKLGGNSIKKVADAIKNLKDKPKVDADGKRIKLKDRLKGIFKKGDSTVTKEELAKNPDATKVAKETDPEADDEDDKDKDKKKKEGTKILGMSVGLFTGLIILFIVIVIAIVLIIRNRKKLAAAKKQVA